MENYREFYRQNLPHLQPLPGTFFVTYRLSGTMPEAVSRQLKADFEYTKAELKNNPNANQPELYDLQKRYFRHYDQYLDQALNGPRWLRQDEIATIVGKSLYYWDQKEIDLICYTITSNHVHCIFTLLMSGKLGASSLGIVFILSF